MTNHYDVDIFQASTLSLQPLTEHELHAVAVDLAWCVDAETFARAVSFAKRMTIERAMKYEAWRFADLVRTGHSV